MPTVHLIDHHRPLVQAWTEAFADLDDVEVHDADFFAIDADAMVSTHAGRT